ncbi:hypothetical protein R1flu_000700 [Riccia fluitans]|uniref:Uncharacterized protein n=1 Tax=Riccia fluitans TaxID=41844 RepID=A0ABD1Y1M0_9MARC
MGDLAGRATVGHSDGGKARQEMQSTDARKSTTAVYDSFIGAQVKAEEACNVAPTLKTTEFEQCILVLPVLELRRENCTLLLSVFLHVYLASLPLVLPSLPSSASAPFVGEESPASTLYSTFVSRC